MLSNIDAFVYAAGMECIRETFYPTYRDLASTPVSGPSRLLIRANQILYWNRLSQERSVFKRACRLQI